MILYTTSLHWNFLIFFLCSIFIVKQLAQSNILITFFSTQDREQKVTRWLKLLIEKSSTFQLEGCPSYGETLLLIAIHFHGHSLEPIIDLVSSTLGIKLRPTNLTKLKLLFTQTIFPEKVFSLFYCFLLVVLIHPFAFF